MKRTNLRYTASVQKAESGSLDYGAARAGDPGHGCKALSRRPRCPITRIRGLILFVLIAVLTALPAALAHEDGAYSHDSSIGYINTDWMARLSKDARLSELSIPGTHDTMAYKIDGPVDCLLAPNITLTQSMDLKTQLESGIRFLDIRGFLVGDVLFMHHGPCYLGNDFETVLKTVVDFLKSHDQEFVLMKVKQENGENERNNTRTWLDVFNDDVSAHSQYIWVGSDNNPTVEDLRGKIVFIQQFPDGSSSPYVDFNWSEFDPYKQDDYELDCHLDLYRKWEAVAQHLSDAATSNADKVHFNFLSGAYSGSLTWSLLTFGSCVVEPYFVASGHKSPGTGAERKDTKVDDTYPATYVEYPDFPRDCQDGSKLLQKAKCDILYEGINTLTSDYLARQTSKQRIGVIIADFPGHLLIDRVIQMNEFPANQKPVADAGGPYVFNEGDAVVLSASGSTDKEDDPLVYRWDYDGDGIWDTEWYSAANIGIIVDDDGSFTVKVGVADDENSPSTRQSTDTADLIVHNVAPSIDSFDISNIYSYANNDIAVIRGTWSDPALGVSTETFSGNAYWSDAPAAPHELTLYSDGTFETSRDLFNFLGIGDLSKEITVTIVISDDDGGTGSATSPSIEVSHAPPTIDSVSMPARIKEGQTVVVTGTFSDPVFDPCDTWTYYEGTALWSDGIWSDLVANLDGTFETSRTFADEWMFSGREDTAEANYNVTITIYDFCRNRAYRTSPTLTVENVSPRITSAYVDTARLAEGETVTVFGTFDDPALGSAFEFYSAKSLWSDGEQTTVIVDHDAGTFMTSRRFGDVGSVPEEFTVQIGLFDDDEGRSDIVTSPPIVVQNAPPVVDEVRVPDHPIFEGREVIVYGRYHDPSGPESSEATSGTALWSDGRRTEVEFLGPLFRVVRTFPDDDPTGTPFDDYTMEIRIGDSDGGISDPAPATVRVRNADPVARIDSLTDETGSAVGTGVRNVLVHTRVGLQGSFTDVGTRDSHAATVDWRDGTTNSKPSTGSVALFHTYRAAGVYPIRLDVVDDDTGAGASAVSITVIDSAEAITEIAADLSGGGQALGAIATSEIRLADTQPTTHESSVNREVDEAVARLSAPGGALELLARGNVNAALVRMWQAMNSLESAESTLNLTPYQSLLALSAKSTALSLILQAEAEAATGEDANKLVEAHELIAQGDSKLALGNFVQAVDLYSQAARKVQGMVNSSR